MSNSDATMRRAKELFFAQSPNMLLAYIAALQEEMLKQLNALATQPRVAPQLTAVQQTPAVSKPIEYEYTSVTVRAGLFFAEDKAINSKVDEMAAQGWELVSNTEARGTILDQPGRMLQFRRSKRR